MIQNSRPKVSVRVGQSIDGYIAKKDGNIDWLYYGHSGDEEYGFKDFINSIDGLILGKNTYEVVSNFDQWPYDGKRVIVLSNSLKNVRPEAELYTGSLKDLLSKLHSEGIKHVWVDGGVTISKFLEEGLVDEISISVIAMILGSGIPLFNPMNAEHKCELLSTKSYPSGLVESKYKILSE